MGRSILVVALAVVGCSKPPTPASTGESPPPAVAPAPPPAPAPPAPVAPPAAPLTEVGTASPTIPLAFADDATWALVCQARKDTDGTPGIRVEIGFHGELWGDAMHAYLIRNGAPDIEVSELHDVSTAGPYGNHLAYTRADGEVVLYHGLGNGEKVLAGAARPGHGSGHTHVSLTRNGERALYIKAASPTDAIAILDLTDGKERVVALPRGKPFMVIPDESGRWARVLAITDDTDGDGALTFPVMQTNLARELCRGGAASYSMFGMKGDRPSTMWLNMDTGAVLADPTILHPGETDPLVRAADGSLRVGRVVLAPASCNARVEGFIPHIPVVLGACAGSGALPMEVFGDGYRKKIAAWMHDSGDDTARLLVDPFYCPRNAGCFDVRDGTAVNIHRGMYLETRDGVMLIAKSTTTLLLDPYAGTHVELPGDLKVLGRYHALIGEQVVDLRTKERLGTIKAAKVIALDLRGRALVAAGTDAESGLLLGPLRWGAPN